MLRNKNVLKILSLVTAICLWLYVVGEINPTTSKTIEGIPVKLLNEDTLEKRGLAVKDGTNFSVDVVVSGKKTNINGLEREKIKATANVFGYEKGTNEIPILVDLPEGITLVEVKTPKIKVELEELISVYKDITVAFKGKTELGTEPGNITTSPAQIEVKGAKSVVNSVDHVRAEINASKITEEQQTFSARPVAINKEGERVYNVELSAKSVEVTAALLYTKTVPLKAKTTGKVSSAYEVVSMDIPNRVTVRGPKSKVEDIRSINAKPVDISDVTASTILKINPILPEGVELADQSKNIGVDIKIKGISSKKVKVSTKGCEIDNLKDGLAANVNTAEVKVTVTGSESILKDVSAKDFTLAIDVSELKEGIHTVPITVWSNKTFYSIKLNPQKVDITIKGDV